MQGLKCYKKQGLDGNNFELTGPRVEFKENQGLFSKVAGADRSLICLTSGPKRGTKRGGVGMGDVTPQVSILLNPINTP